MSPKDANKVLVGKSGWLFLQNDTNDVIGQHTGKVTLGDEGRAQWESVLRGRKAVADELGIRSVSLIAPDKEAVYAEYLPDEVVPAERRPVHDILDAAETAGIDMVYPVAQFEEKKLRRPLYSLSGTHWNSFGAYIAYRVICKRLRSKGAKVGIVPPTEIEWRRGSGDNDLGSKLGRAPDAGDVSADLPGESARVVFDNRIINHGRVVVFEGPSSGPTGLVFGESFATWLTRFLKEGFSRLVFMHSSTIPREILELERPDALIAVPTERMMISPPDESRALADFLDTVGRKRRGRGKRNPVIRMTGRLGADVSQPGELPWDEEELGARVEAVDGAHA